MTTATIEACEGCGTTENLTLCACGGGACGDVYLCATEYAEHAAECEVCELRCELCSQTLCSDEGTICNPCRQDAIQEAKEADHWRTAGIANSQYLYLKLNDQEKANER